MQSHLSNRKDLKKHPYCHLGQMFSYMIWDLSVFCHRSSHLTLAVEYVVNDLMLDNTFYKRKTVPLWQSYHFHWGNFITCNFLSFSIFLLHCSKVLKYGHTSVRMIKSITLLHVYWVDDSIWPRLLYTVANTKNRKILSYR